MIPEHAVILITGASSGIGAAVARRLAAPGRVLHLQGRDEARLGAVAADVIAGGAVVHRHMLDLLDHEATDRGAADLAASVPRLDVLVHSAGLCVMSEIESIDIGDLDRQYSVNLRAPVVLTRALVPSLVAAEGQVIFVNSGAGLRTFPAWGAYAATKFGLRAIADTFRSEIAPRGVRVTSIHPGRIATPMQAEVHRMEGRSYDPSAFPTADDVAASIAHTLEMPRRAVVTELSLRPPER